MGQNRDRQGAEADRPAAALEYLITWVCYGSRLPGRAAPSRERRIDSAAIHYVVREQGEPMEVFENGAYSPFLLSHSAISPAISRLFFSSIIMCPFPRMPASASLTQVG